MNRKPYATTIKHDVMEAIKQSIEILLQTKPIDDETKHLLCSLEEVRSIFYKKLDKGQLEYRCTFTPAQAFALRRMATDYMHDKTTHLGNRMHKISAEVHQHYS